MEMGLCPVPVGRSPATARLRHCFRSGARLNYRCSPHPRARAPSMNGDRVFHIGDKVVYPNHVVGIIEQISSRTMGATVEKFYHLNIAAASLKVNVPFA